MQEINQKNVKMLPKELPVSSYEVIRLPTTCSTNKPPPHLCKGVRDQQQRAKRQKVMPSLTSQADEFRSKPDMKCPTFKKTLVRSHVSGCFWMGLPQGFCRMHLPSVDTYFVLEIYNGKQYKTKYLADRTAFSGGWRELSLAEKLSEGDVLIFQLVNPTKFKIFRIRKSGSRDMAGALVKTNSVYRKKQSDVTGLELSKETHRASSLETVARDEDHGLTIEEIYDKILQKSDNAKNITLESNSGDPKLAPVPPVFGEYNHTTTSDDLILEQNKETHRASSPVAVSQDEDHAAILSKDNENMQKTEIIQKITLESDVPDSPVVGDYDGCKTFNDFKIVVEELPTKDYTLPCHIKQSYCQLCSSQKSVLHANLLKDVNPILIAGCIIETVDIANAMMSCELPTFDSYFAKWDQKLKSLEFLGMNVGFLSARLLHLQKIACNSQVVMKRQKCSDLCTEHANTEKTITSLQDKLAELRRIAEKQADEIGQLKMEINDQELRFREQVSAPW